MVTIEDTKTGNTFEVTEEHWDQNLWRVKRYKKAEKKPAGRPKKTYTEETEE